ncbi:MAG: hypothetical protein ACLU80_02780, partial [Dorea sp.]
YEGTSPRNALGVSESKNKFRPCSYARAVRRCCISAREFTTCWTTLKSGNDGREHICWWRTMVGFKSDRILFHDMTNEKSLQEFGIKNCELKNKMMGKSETKHE